MSETEKFEPIFECDKCGAKLPINIPVCFNGYIGHKSERCKCGRERAILEAASKEKEAFWNQVLDAAKGGGV